MKKQTPAFQGASAPANVRQTPALTASVPPQTFPLCEREAGAQRIGYALNEAHRIDGPLENSWAVQRGVPVGPWAKEREDYRVVSPQDLYRRGHTDPTLIAFCRAEADARHIAHLLGESAGATAACSCDGITQTCSNCPAGSKDLPKRATRAENDSPGITYNHFKDELRTLEGRVLTIIDAAFSSESQNKALKSILKREFRQQMGTVYEFCHRGWNLDETSDLGAYSDDSDRKG